MNCSSCNAQLAPGSGTCYFCGARQARSWRGTAGRSATQQRWGASSTSAEGWRTWTSFFLAGLYAPIAARFLVLREEHLAGLRKGQLPPTSPSQVGRVVLGLFIGVPALAVAAMAFVANASSVHRSSAYFEVGEDRWVSLQAAHSAILVNLFVALVYAASVVVARWAERRFELLLAHATDEDPHVIRLYRQGSTSRAVATVVALLPLAMIAVYSVVVFRAGWDSSLSGAAGLWLPLVIAAAWASSWLNIHAASRYRAVLSSVP
jgi:hypothetical protein